MTFFEVGKLFHRAVHEVDDRLRAMWMSLKVIIETGKVAKSYSTTNAAGPEARGDTILDAASSRITGVKLDGAFMPLSGLTIENSADYLDAGVRDLEYNNARALDAENLSAYLLRNPPSPSYAGAVNYEHTDPHGYIDARQHYLRIGSKYASLTDDLRESMHPALRER